MVYCDFGSNNFVFAMMEKILTMLVGLLIALGGWSLSRTFELSTFQAVHNNQIDKLERKVEKLQDQMDRMMDSDEEIIVIINFDTVSHTIDIEFPHSGIWHEYLSDTQIDINSNWFGGYTLEPLSSYIFTSSISNECNLGDINEDSIVNVIDIVSLVNHILNDTEINFCSGDLNGDGIINVIDIISLVNIIMS